MVTLQHGSFVTFRGDDVEIQPDFFNNAMTVALAVAAARVATHRPRKEGQTHRQARTASHATCVLFCLIAIVLSGACTTAPNSMVAVDCWSDYFPYPSDHGLHQT